MDPSEDIEDRSWGPLSEEINTGVKEWISSHKKHLNVFQKNINQQLNEIRKKIQNMKEVFNKDIAILKKLKLT